MILIGAGCPNADELVSAWFRVGDFLLNDVAPADLVVGNPPYIRADNLDPTLVASYRAAYPTMSRRADIFVGFFERGLDVLKPNGRLVYICADRWMRNGYGKDLRAKIIRGFSVDDVIVMHDADAFAWTGEYLVSPWQGRTLVDIQRYPHLRAYYEGHCDQLLRRNVAKRSTCWWRTIDSFNPSLLEQDLLVMQDMKLHAHPVRVPAGFYPHHGLTWFASNSWDLDVLGGLLLSEPFERQVAAHCVRMRGGTLRFQPTVVRMVRIPDRVSGAIAAELAAAFRTHDRARANEAAWQLFPPLPPLRS